MGKSRVFLKERWWLLAVPVFFFTAFIIIDDDVITWSANRKLTWDDYKGKPQKRFAAASTVYSLGRWVDASGGKPVAVISAYFYCSDSWKRTDWINDEVLAHEQKHFDMVEWYARKIRKELATGVYKNLEQATEKAESLYQQYNKEMDQMQDQYDNDTDGSMNGDTQRDWNKKIEAGLKALEAYSKSRVVLCIKSGN